MASTSFLFAAFMLLLSLVVIASVNDYWNAPKPDHNTPKPEYKPTPTKPDYNTPNPKEIIILISGPKYQIMRNKTFQKERMSYYQQSSLFKGLFYANQAPSTSHLKVISTYNCFLWSLQLLLMMLGSSVKWGRPKWDRPCVSWSWKRNDRGYIAPVWRLPWSLWCQS